MHKAYVFDAYGTLFDVHSAIARQKATIGPKAEAMSETWRTKQIEYTWNTSLMGRWRDFRDLTAAALDTAAALHGGLPEGLRDKLVAAYEELDAYPDVAPALRALRAAGAKTAILSNGSREMLANATRAAGLTDLLDAVISVDEVRIYKTSPRVYALVEATLGVAPGDVAFQSSNRWDVAGAKAFGFDVNWVNRTGKPDEYVDLPPDRVIGSLSELT
ncbi:(S)-2-haloacid dehalogenase 1 [Beijerinckiaceae bacterium RH AL1]|nr:haloacid dehalogenase type II [Beijerinckiaceae bacterium]VVB47308.1 (S)-2-haloacid dehalogenase 1 [Beijerinckiaceae bacterium RH CH11]VVB47391.1 (S)-2-haloacid dehalogenase 1 [Beijerinckiaceae bacterium RH AL8]VVC55821.1 (S)-2-haloacid dehalogenase 1 [Beijerinckiaceae bacterium RH AL1]